MINRGWLSFGGFLVRPRRVESRLDHIADWGRRTVSLPALAWRAVCRLELSANLGHSTAVMGGCCFHESRGNPWRRHSVQRRTALTVQCCMSKLTESKSGIPQSHSADHGWQVGELIARHQRASGGSATSRVRGQTRMSERPRVELHGSAIGDERGRGAGE